MDFYAISVREYSAIKIVKKLTGRNSVVLLDPTMALTSAQWETYCKPVRSLKGKKYILKYILGDSNKDVSKCIHAIQNNDDSNIKVVDLMDEGNKYYSAGPDEFLWLIKNADMILTDSFHATVFSIIFHKPFVVFRRSGKDGVTFGRLNTLLSQFHLEDREYNSMSANSTRSIDFKYADSVLVSEKKRTVDFLNKALNSKVENEYGSISNK